MRQEVIIESLSRRVRQGPNLVLIALVGGMFCIFRLAAGLPGPGLWELVMPFLLLFLHLALAPVPWQWTGDERPRAPMGRGILQALLFNGLWVSIALGGLLVADRPPVMMRSRPLEMGPPPPMDGPRPFPGPRPGLPPAWGLVLLNVSFAVVFGWVFAEKEATEARERETAGLLRESRSKALQGQLEPHVLYNALSGLSELVYEDPLAAEEVITQLAELYRMLTVHGKAERVALAQERRLVEAYLAMEQMRLGERLAVEWEWAGELDSLQAPPLFLQPLVENAIKHGISPSELGGTLRIRGLRAGDRVVLAVENTGLPLVDGAPRGIGLGNLEARLALMPELDGRFRLAPRDGWTVAQVDWTSEAAA